MPRRDETDLGSIDRAAWEMGLSGSSATRGSSRILVPLQAVNTGE